MALGRPLSLVLLLQLLVRDYESCFGNLYWCGIGENDSLLSYVKRLRRALAGNSVPFGRKKFSPHITLIRRTEYDRRRGFLDVAVPDVAMHVSGVSLMRSDRTKSGMLYTEVEGLLHMGRNE